MITGRLRKILGRIRRRVLFHLLGGTARISIGGYRAKFECANIEEFGRVITFGGERAYMNRVMAHVREGDVVWDIGANIGTHTTFFGLAIGESGYVYGFEPEPHMAAKAANNAELNDLTNVEIVRIGLSDQEGVARLSVDNSPGSGKHRFGGLAGAEQIDVEITRGDSIISSGRVIAPTVIKIDIEGHEFSAMSGLTDALASPDCRVVACEIHREALIELGTTAEMFEKFLRDHGFGIDRVATRGNEYHVICTRS